MQRRNLLLATQLKNQITAAILKAKTGERTHVFSARLGLQLGSIADP